MVGIKAWPAWAYLEGVELAYAPPPRKLNKPAYPYSVDNVARLLVTVEQWAHMHPPLMDLMFRMHNSLCGHVARPSRLEIGEGHPSTSSSSAPDWHLFSWTSSWSHLETSPGCPRSKLRLQIHSDKNLPPADLCRFAFRRGHSGVMHSPRSCRHKPPPLATKLQATVSW